MLLVLWPVVFGLVLTVLRVVVLAIFGPPSPQYAALALSLPGMITTGAILGLPLHFLRRSRWRWAWWPFIAVAVLLNVAAFHYEAVFHRLPGSNVLYYVREAAHLTSSAVAHAPLWAVVLEVIVVLAILIRSAERPFAGLQRTVAAVVIVCVLITIATLIKPDLVPRRFAWQARTPILWALQSATLNRSYESISRDQFVTYQRKLGHVAPFAGLDERYPLCDPTPRSGTANGRSVIFLILESVAGDEMKQMPALQRIARESVTFSDVKAGGTKSLQAMPALFAGIPPQPAAHLLWREPLNNIDGFPRLLRQHGYRTAYFHGGDLSFEQQRPFLRMAGFEEIVELDPTEHLPIYGWGYSDDVVFAKMERWIESHRPSPYLATLFTLSTHDPYVIPNGQAPNLRAAFTDSLQFLDEQLRRFYEWYLRAEAPRGTILVITGDHAPHLSGEKHIEDDQVTRFDMPLIVHGPPPAVSNTPAAHYDVPATILGLVGLPPGPCDQGLDLFSPVPGDRTRYAVAGDQLEDFYIWTPKASVHLDLSRRDAQAVLTNRGSGDDAVAATREAGDFYRVARDISAYLVRANAFAPPPPSARRPALPRVTRPVFVAHRQNSRAAIEQALAEGFQWVEIDINLTKDHQLVAAHDDVSSKTRAALGEVMTLEEIVNTFAGRTGLLIEIKPQNNLAADSTLALRSSLLVRGRGRIVMDSYSSFIASSLKQHCQCPVGQDAPTRPLDSLWIDSVAQNGLDWIYVDYRQVSAELIRYAHQRGLRVAVFTVNDLREIARLNREWPDAVITDRIEVMKGWGH